LFAEGEAVKPEGEGLSITGLVSGAGGAAGPAVLVLVLAGLIFVSLMVVKGSVDHSANPILKQSHSADKLSRKNIRPDIERTRKIWKED
jgi:hypothetical protein